MNKNLPNFKVMKFINLKLLLLAVYIFGQGCSVNKVAGTKTARDIWTKEQANTWYAEQGWVIGSNYVPSTAINQLEMWQAETFDTAAINRELGWAASLGMNTSRVFLHDLLYEQDSLGFYQRINTFLGIAQRHHIKPLLVLFDSVWDPYPKLGKQREPRAHVHNSGWVQSPGYEALKDTTQQQRLEKYVKGTVKRFAQDARILGWDVWNEPDNINQGSAYGKAELPDKVKYVQPLLKKVFVWTRAGNPSQPVTAAIWAGDWSGEDKLKPIEKLMLEQSDIISFHNYDDPAEFEKRVVWLQRYERPIICTEYMARPNKSTFEGSLPIAKKYNIGMYNWGFVNGKSQTIFPWDSWDKQYGDEPPVWFHDIFRQDGTPYRQAEVDFIRKLTGAKALTSGKK